MIALCVRTPFESLNTPNSSQVMDAIEYVKLALFHLVKIKLLSSSCVRKARTSTPDSYDNTPAWHPFS